MGKMFLLGKLICHAFSVIQNIFSTQPFERRQPGDHFTGEVLLNHMSVHSNSTNKVFLSISLLGFEGRA